MSGIHRFLFNIASSGLKPSLSDVEVKLYDKEEIEKILLESRDGMLLCKRFFPISYKIWASKNPNKTIFLELPDLHCEHCRASLLVYNHGQQGIVVAVIASDKSKIENIYTSCNGKCDRLLLDKYLHESVYDSWEQLSDLCMPVNYLRYLMKVLNMLYGGTKLSDDAKLRLKDILCNLFPYICREQSEEELSRVEDLYRFGLF